MDNPYIAVKAYLMSMDYKFNKTVKLRKCSRPQLLRMMSPLVATYYPNSVCLDDEETVVLKNNWFNSEFLSLMVTVE